MRLLVTGMAGFIGSHLTQRLLARGDTVVGLDCFDETLYPAALHQRNLDAIGDPPSLTFVRGNFLDAPTVARLFEQRFDVVVHLGALAGVRPSIAQPHRYQRTNIEGTLNLIEACRTHGIDRFVFASSSSVYGARSNVPFREDDPCDHPASPYAFTKKAGELLLSNYSELHRIGTTCLRFFTVYGPRQRPEMAIAKFTRAILAGAPIPFFGDGSTARDYTYIDDIIDGVVASIDRCTPAAHRVYNLGGSRTTTLSALITLLETDLGKKAILDRQPNQPGDVPLTSADVTRAGAELGYAPQVPIEEGLTRFCRWLTTGA